MKAVEAIACTDRADTVELADLLGYCQSGDTAAWERLIRMFSPVVWTVIRSHGLTGHDADDAYQRTWQRLVENLHTLREPGRLGAWLVTVAKREAVDHIVKSRRLVCVSDSEILEGAPALEPTPEERVVARSRNDGVLNAVRRLPADQQALLGMLFTDPPMSYDTISSALGIPRGSIGPRRQRILKRVRAMLGRTTDAG